MAMLYGDLAKNGEILDFVDCGNNNYMISINIGNQRNKISSYTHIKSDKGGIKVINSNLGNVLLNDNKKSVIIREPDNGYYIYNVDTGTRVSEYYKTMKFVNVEDFSGIYATDVIRNDIGTIFIELGCLLDYDGNILSDIYNVLTNEYYKGVYNSLDYIELKKSLRKQLDSNKSIEEEICRKLIKTRR